MSKRSTFTSITPLPPTISRQTALAFLHDHLEMIDLNPLVKERHRIPVPDHASPDEQHCIWYSLTDEIVYIPGISGAASDVSYTCAFHDLPIGLQTHCYAPMGLDIRDRWSVGGTMPGEPPEPRELGLDLPAQGLYLREDVDIRCNILMTSFVKKTLKKSHGALVKKLASKAASFEGSRSANTSQLYLGGGSSGTPSQRGHTPRARSMDPPRRPSPGSSIASYHSKPSPPPPLGHINTPPPGHASSGFLFPRDSQGQVAWQTLTTKQQQQRSKEHQRLEREAARTRSHSQPPLSPLTQSPEDMQYELPVQMPVELPAPNYPASDSYGDIAGKTPFDDKTPITPSDQPQRPFDVDGAHFEQPGQQQQQRHPTVLKPGGYAIARKPVAMDG